MAVIGLIAGISGEILTQKLHDRGYQVAMIAGMQNESGTDIADYVLIEDLRNKESIKKFLQEKGVEGVVIGTGHILALQLAEYLAENGFQLSNDVKASLVAKDKTLYKRLLQEKGFKTPKYIHIETIDNVPQIEEVVNYIGLPCVVKSTIDKKLPQRANTEEELKDAISELKGIESPILLEQYVEGIDTTVPVIVKGNAAEAIIVSYYSKARACHLKGFDDLYASNNSVDKLDVETEKALRAVCERVALETGLAGLCRIDAIVTKDGEIMILEANSIMVTGVHEKQIEYGREFLQNEGIDFAGLLVESAIDRFNLTH